MDEPQDPLRHSADPASAPAWALLLDDVAHPAALLDDRGLVLRANALFSRACGLPQQALQGRALSQARPDLWQVLAPLLGSSGQASLSNIDLPTQVLEASGALRATVRVIESGEAKGGQAQHLLWLSLRPRPEEEEASMREEDSALRLVSRLAHDLAAELDSGQIVASVVRAASAACAAPVAAFFARRPEPSEDLDEDSGTGSIGFLDARAPVPDAVAGEWSGRVLGFEDGFERGLFDPVWRGGLLSLCDAGFGLGQGSGPEAELGSHGLEAPQVLAEPEASVLWAGTPMRDVAPLSWLGVPVVLREGAVLGGLFLGRQARGGFSGRDQEAARGLAGLASVALGNAVLQSELQSQRAQFEESERRYRFLSESIPQIVWVARSDGEVSYINGRGVEYFGTDPERSPNALWVSFVHPDDVEQASQAWAQALQSRLPFEVRYRLRRHDGIYRWFLGLSLPLPLQEGRAPRWVGTCTDIDAPQRAEESLRLLADAGEILTSSLDEARPLQALAHRLVPGLADWCLFERVLPGGKFEALALLHAEPGKAQALRDLRHHALSNHSSALMGRVIRSRRAEMVPVLSEEMLQSLALDDLHLKYLLEVGFSSFICVPLLSRGQALGALMLARGQGRPYEPEDLALAEELARRAAQAMDNAALYRQAQRALQAAQEAGHAKDSFLATVSHELRTPLTSILGWANLLKSGRVNPEMTRNALETIERNVKTQAQIIEDLLDVSRIVAGKLVLEMRPVELAPIIDSAIQAVRPAIDAKGIALHFEAPGVDGAPGARAVVSGDTVKLQQVVWNILSNAVKFTPRGGRIQVSVRVHGSQVALTVRDSGPGVPAEFAAHIFERFRQADSSSTRRHGGLGLGLAIVRHLVEMHGGSVRLEPPSEPAELAVEGEGACFVVELPLLAVVDEAPLERPDAGDDYARVMLKGRSVLVVEDEDDSRHLLDVVLSRFGARVRLASSAPEAWQALQQEKPDVLISDIGMPGEDGYSLIRRVRARFSSQELPSIALTAYAANTDRETALQAGFDAHVSKPSSPIHLAMTVASLLAARQGAAQGSST